MKHEDRKSVIIILVAASIVVGMGTESVFQTGIVNNWMGILASFIVSGILVMLMAEKEK